MARLTYGETTVELPKYKLRELRAAAPFITRALRSSKHLREIIPVPELATADMAASGDLVETMFGGIGDVLGVLAIGIIKARLLAAGTYTGPNKEERPYEEEKVAAIAEDIESELGMDQMGLLNSTFVAILGEAGMVRASGRPTTTPPVATAGSTLESGSSE